MSFWKRRGTTPPVLADSGAYPCQVNRLSRDPCIFASPSLGVKSEFLPCDGDSNAFFFSSVLAWMLIAMALQYGVHIVEPLLIPESERGHVGLEVVSDNAW